MLVLYTLFQSISSNMPPTAYLKLLDIWLIFCLVITFLICVFQVTWELIKENEANEVKPLYPVTKSIKYKCKITCEIGIPVLSGLFSMIYVLLVSSKYFT